MSLLYKLQIACLFLLLGVTALSGQSRKTWTKCLDSNGDPVADCETIVLADGTWADAVCVRDTCIAGKRILTHVSASDRTTVIRETDPATAKDCYDLPGYTFITSPTDSTLRFHYPDGSTNTATIRLACCPSMQTDTIQNYITDGDIGFLHTSSSGHDYSFTIDTIILSLIHI